MRITLISDIHLGVKNNSEQFLENTKKFFMNQVCDVIKKEKSKLLFILGDLFDNRQNTNVLVKNVAMEVINHILKEFPDISIKILAGNHDVFYKNTNEISSINIFKQFDQRVEVVSQITKYDFDGCKTVAVPWIFEGGKNDQVFKKIVNHFNSTNKRSFDLCLGHFHINGFEVVKGVVEEKGLKQSDFEAFENVFSGHFHIRNKIGNIQYLGSPFEITWNDWGDTKGITVFDTETRETRFYENILSPKHILVKTSQIEADETILESIKGQFVKFVVDKTVSADKRLNMTTVLESNNQDFNLLDETVTNIDGEDVSIEDSPNISGTPMEFMWKFCEELKIPETIEKDELKIYLDNLYTRSVKDSE